MPSSKHYIERLKLVIEQLHNCSAAWVETVPVREVFRGKAIWKGFVEVFDLAGHPKAKRAYGWSHVEGPDETDERFVIVLGLPPVNSAQEAALHKKPHFSLTFCAS